jgi:hypothetical protein
MRISPTEVKAAMIVEIAVGKHPWRAIIVGLLTLVVLNMRDEFAALLGMTEEQYRERQHTDGNRNRNQIQAVDREVRRRGDTARYRRI